MKESKTMELFPFENISVRGFRRLCNVDLPLRPLNVVIGANGSGKTSLLDVFSLLASSAAGNLGKTLQNMGGIASNLSNLVSSPDISDMTFALKQLVPHAKPIAYQLELKPQGVDFVIQLEQLSQDRGDANPFLHVTSQYNNVKYFESKVEKRLMSPDWEYNTKESALSQVPKMFDEPEAFRKDLASSTHYHVLDVSQKAPVRLPQSMRTATLPGKDGEDLVSCLYMIRETDNDRFELIQDTLRAGFPNFERLNFPPVAAGTLAMTWKDTTSGQPFYMHQLSEGTLRFLWLVTLLYSPGLTAVTMIDEPEVSLHPELLSVLADLFRDASSRTQLIIATHADRLVRFLKPEEIITTTIEDDGSTSFAWGSEFDLEEWLKDYTLDQLWGMGRLGGRA